tara:strand:- start:177 stop:728 length:552 start_codon:yes stop_codon:yes gene_type:complete
MALTKVRGLGLGTLDDNITFSTAGKGVHLGVTSATSSNLLEDYEEGSWTPTYVGSGSNHPTITYDKQNGYYVKVGQLVHCQGRLRTDATSGGGDSLFLGGLPFTTTSASEGYSVLHIGFSVGWGADHYPAGGYVNINSTTVTLRLFDSSDPRDGFNTALLPSDLTNSADSNDIIFSLTYRTDS